MVTESDSSFVEHLKKVLRLVMRSSHIRACLAINIRSNDQNGSMFLSSLSSILQSFGAFVNTHE
jgi:hypothetical protein